MPYRRKRLLEDIYALQMVLARVIVSSRGSFSQALGLNRAQGEALFFIQYRECRTIGQLAGALGVTSGAATQVVESLEKLGLVMRERREDDKRVVEIRYTEKGEDQLEAMRDYHFARLEGMMAGLSSEELEELLALQLKMLQRMQLETTKAA